jgi:isopenicillin-N epimerase
MPETKLRGPESGLFVYICIKPLSMNSHDHVKSRFANLWTLNPEIDYLNHGSFGACPAPLLERQSHYRRMLEQEPIRFLVQTVEPLLQQARENLAAMTGARAGDLVFVANATAGVNTVFRSLSFEPGDEILFTNHIYGACRKAIEYVAARTGARLVEAKFPFPISSPEIITDSVLSAVTPKTKIALIDHISSATALVHPVEELTRHLESRGIAVMIDGAHALGSIPLDLEALGASYYTANCHKWLCAPKGAAILHVRKDRQEGIVPLVISHAGYDAPFAERFYWPGTWDPSACLCAGDAVGFIASLMPGGWPEVMKRNHELCLTTRKQICDMLEIPLPCPDEMIAVMATFPLPEASGETPHDYKSFSSLQEALFEQYHIEIPVWNWDFPTSRLTRIAVQLYNDAEQFTRLGLALKSLLS